jgi:maltose-binding protein MalE
MKKTLKILATTSASTLLLSLTTACGSEEPQHTNQDSNKKELNTVKSEKSSSALKLSIKESQGSLDALRCIGGGRCVLQDR